MDDILRTCCGSLVDLPHVKYCKWARKHCPAWLDPFLTNASDARTRHHAYRMALKETVLMKTYPDGSKKSGKVLDCWQGRNGWPVVFRVAGSTADWGIDTVTCLSTKPCIYPRRPTAEEMYELLTREP